jgi:hypothetical protein
MSRNGCQVEFCFPFEKFEGQRICRVGWPNHGDGVPALPGAFLSRQSTTTGFPDQICDRSPVPFAGFMETVLEDGRMNLP